MPENGFMGRIIESVVLSENRSGFSVGCVSPLNDPAKDIHYENSFY